MGLERTRVTEVYARGPGGNRVGSGYLLADGLVLTARHVVEPSTAVEVRPLGTTEWTPALVAWSDEAADAALVRTEDPIQARGAAPVWGVVEGREPVAVTAVGFPWARARPSGVRDTEQLFGHVAPLSGAKEGRYAINVTTSPPQRPDGASGWAGMSGATLFAGPYLVGVVVVDPDRFGPERVVATPVAVLAANGDCARLVGVDALARVGSRFRLEVAPGRSVALIAPYRAMLDAVDAAAAPVELLVAAHGIVPFLGREAELAELVAWCAAERSMGVRVITGAGGSGKTRLGAEACVAVAAQGWVGNFADPRVPRGQVLAELEDPTLVVVDEADTLPPDDLAALVTTLTYGPVPARLLLVARDLGLWLDRLAQEVPSLEGLLAQPIVLDAVRLDDDGRRRHFAAAAAAFAPRLGAPVPTQAPWELNDDAFAVPLLVHISALLAVLGEGRGSGADPRRQVLEGLLRRERQRWKTTAVVAGLSDLAPEVAGRAVAVASMVGAGDEAEAAALLTAVADLSDASHERRAKLARWLHELYAGDAYVNPLQPDVLMAHHLGRVLTELPDLPVRLVDLAPGRRLRLISALARAFPEIEEGVDYYRVLAEANPDAFLPLLALSLTYLSEHLGEVGQPEAALGPAEEAVDYYRVLAEANPDAFLPDLVLSLTYLSHDLGEVGRREAALGPIEEAVEICRVRAEADPDAFLPALAASLDTLSVQLGELGRREAAVGPAEEAVEICRALAEANPDAFLPDLARSLTNLSHHLGEVGRREAAVGPAEEAVSHYRVLAEANPDAFLPALAASLDTLSIRLGELGQEELCCDRSAGSCLDR